MGQIYYTNGDLITLDKSDFIIKDLELLEISVVAVPANQDSLFSLAKGFDSDKDFDEFKKQFLPTT